MSYEQAFNIYYTLKEHRIESALVTQKMKAAIADKSLWFLLPLGITITIFGITSAIYGIKYLLYLKENAHAQTLNTEENIVAQQLDKKCPNYSH